MSLTSILRITNGLITSKSIPISKNNIIKEEDDSNSIIDKAIVKANIINKVNIRTF